TRRMPGQGMQTRLLPGQSLALQQVLSPQLQQSLLVLQTPLLELRNLVQQEIIRSRNCHHRKIRLRPDYRGRAHPVIPRERDLFPSLAEPDCAAQAAAFGGRASSAGVGARGPAVRQGSAREAVGSAFLVQAYAEFTGVAD